MAGRAGGAPDGTGRVSGVRWTAQEDASLRARYPHESTQSIAADLGRTAKAVYLRAAVGLGLRKTAAYLSTAASGRLHADSQIAHRFAKGHATWNKGMRRPGWAPGRMKTTQFRAGERHGRAQDIHKPIGAERLTKNGYLQRKVNEDLPFNRRWRLVHVLVWEASHGPVPKGHAVVFVNGDKRDIRLENLALITRAELMRRNTVHNYGPEVAKTVQLIGALKRQIRRRTRDAGQQSL